MSYRGSEKVNSKYDEARVLVQREEIEMERTNCTRGRRKSAVWADAHGIV